VQPHWLTALCAAVNRFTVSTQIRHFVMAITVMDSANFGDLLLGLMKLISVVVVTRCAEQPTQARPAPRQ
jgi:hypothetical protein